MQMTPGRIIEKQMVNAYIESLCQLYHHFNRGGNLVVFIAADLAAVKLGMISKLVL